MYFSKGCGCPHALSDGGACNITVIIRMHALFSFFCYLNLSAYKNNNNTNNNMMSAKFTAILYQL